MSDIISSCVNVDDSKGQNKQIFVQLHFIAPRSLSIFTFYSSGDFDSFLTVFVGPVSLQQSLQDE